jgi:uncharacterized protein
MSFAVGLLTGLTSMGGAALMTPFLILAVGMRPIFAVGTDLIYGALTRIVGACMHLRHGTVDLRTAFQLAAGSIPGGVAGFLLFQVMQQHGVNPDQYLKRAIGFVLMIVACITIFKTFYPAPLTAVQMPAQRLKIFTIAWGALVGLAVGITSVGSGSLVAPFLLILYPKDPARIVGTDVVHSALLVATTAMLYTNAGKVEWSLLPTLLAGSIPGVILGSYYATRLPVRSLRVSLGILLLATGIKLV